MNQLNCLSKAFLKLSGMKLKTWIKSTRLFYIKFLLYMIVSFQRKKKVKTKDLQSPWLTKGIRTLSKRKKRLYEKVLKKRN